MVTTKVPSETQPVPSSPIEGRNYIGGRWTVADTEQTFERRSPANIDLLLGVFPRSGQKDVEAAVQAAREAYPTWSRMSRIKRAEYLDSFVQIVKADFENLARLMAMESGKQINESRADVTEGVHMAQFCFGRARMPYGDVVASEIAEKESYALRKPKGVIACISPWNFPFAIPLWLICPSLVEGNTVVFKPAEETPGVAQRLVEYFEKAGLPQGVLNLVQGFGEEAGWPLVLHPNVDVVLFTGSREVGLKIKETCGKHQSKMAVCEMGGKNGIIVLDDADLELAVPSSILSAFKTTGQRCVSTGRLIVQEKVLKEFTDKFVDLAQHLRIGDPLDEAIFMGPLVSKAGLEKVLFYNRLAQQEGADVLLDMSQPRGEGLANGYYTGPFVYMMEHWPDSRVLREEVFGPHVAIIPCRDLDHAIRIYNDTDYGMALSVITEDSRKMRQVREACEFGVGYWNLPTIGAEVQLPFGGVKASGTGLPSASTLIDAVTHRVSWTQNYGREIRMAQGLSARAA
ncbi:MAG: aldehyde dehydrogenase family protein [Chloroflexi bacterium]|nr:aldehyde dehydrogenase family protein [Chloroflexota bacterium]